MSALGAIMYREGKIRATNLTFIFWDLFYPLGYLLVFGVGMTQAMGMKPAGIGVDYNAFFLAASWNGQLRYRVEYRVVVLHGQVTAFLRDADLSHETVGLLAR